MAELRLRPLRAGDESAARVAHEELQRDDFGFLLHWDPSTPWEVYLASLAAIRRGDDLPEGLVPATFLVGDVGGEIVDRALVTCDDRNAASARVIERLGGALEDIRTDPEDGALVRRFWIA